MTHSFRSFNSQDQFLFVTAMKNNPIRLLVTKYISLICFNKFNVLTSAINLVYYCTTLISFFNNSVVMMDSVSQYYQFTLLVQQVKDDIR